uniref:Protein kinase domain-containing protein n=1 Tax=Ascaris lumbricoides TaxID=6252 RepID=A0A0M3I459_ASCLU
MVRSARCSRGATSDPNYTDGKRTPPLTPMHALCSTSTVSLCVVVCLLTRQLLLPNVSLDWNGTCEVLGSDYAACAHHLTVDEGSSDVKEAGVASLNSVVSRHRFCLHPFILQVFSASVNQDRGKKEFPTSMGFLRALLHYYPYSSPTADARVKKWRLKPLSATGKDEFGDLELITDTFSRISIGDRVLRPLLASAPPRPNLWSPMTSAADPAIEEFDFVDMMWWHEFDAEKTANIAGCSASDRLHLLIHDEKAKRKDCLSACTQLTESNEEKVQHLKAHYEADALTALQEVQDTCAARECKSCESPSTDRFDYSFNSTFDAQEGPVLHDVSLAEAASFSAINATESSLGPVFVSWPLERAGCDATSPLNWDSCERDCCIPDTDYRSTSIVELLDDAEPSLCFSANVDFLRWFSASAADTNASWDVSQRRPVCLSPQFRLPSNECPSNGFCSKTNSSSVYRSQLSESLDGEERLVLEMSSSSAIPPRFHGSSSPVFHENDEDGCSTASAHSSRSRTRSSGQMEERQSERQDTRGPGRRSRDEELARQYALPASAAQISSMPLIELNRLMHTAQLSQVQQHIVRKIRRRGMLLELLPPQRYYACNLSLINSQQKTSFNDLYRKNPSLFIGIRPNRSSANCHATSLFLSMSNLA